MKVLRFGTYERAHPRNAHVAACLRLAGVEVVDRHEPVWDDVEHKWKAGAGAGLRLARAELRLLRPAAAACDAVLVGYPGHLDLPAARRAAPGRPLVFDPLVSLWDTLVADRRRFAPGSLAARALRAIDRLALRRADLVVADTDAQASFYAALAQLPRQRVATCFVGADERVFAPHWRGGEHVLFVGKLIPLHGLETILAAARLVPDLRLRIVGSGQREAVLARRPANVEWVPWLPYHRLGEEYRSAAAALGVFGDSDKARRVIPSKAFHALACGTPLVTADTPAARELLADGESALLVPPANAEALADALRRIVGDEGLARRVGAGGLAAYRGRASEHVLGARWRSLLLSLR